MLVEEVLAEIIKGQKPFGAGAASERCHLKVVESVSKIRIRSVPELSHKGPPPAAGGGGGGGVVGGGVD
jgi:hypothetical protein